MGKKRVAILSGLAAACITSQAIAMMSVPIGWYIEANVGSATLSDANFPGKSSSSGIGGNADIGYKFMPYLAGEIGYSQYPNTLVRNFSGQKAGTVKYYSYDLAARGILPIVDSGVELFAKIGVSRLSANASVQHPNIAAGIGFGHTNHSDTNLYLAIGIQYYFMPEFAINAQWARAKGNSATGSMELLSGGFSFIFE